MKIGIIATTAFLTTIATIYGIGPLGDTDPATVLELAHNTSGSNQCEMLDPARPEVAEYAEHYVWCATSEPSGTIYAFNAVHESKQLISFNYPDEFTGDLPWTH